MEGKSHSSSSSSSSSSTSSNANPSHGSGTSHASLPSDQPVPARTSITTRTTINTSSIQHPPNYSPNAIQGVQRHYSKQDIYLGNHLPPLLPPSSSTQSSSSTLPPPHHPNTSSIPVPTRRGSALKITPLMALSTTASNPQPSNTTPTHSDPHPGWNNNHQWNNSSLKISILHPRVTSVNLDRRLPLKLKRGDFEPLPKDQSSILNISQPIHPSFPHASLLVSANIKSSTTLHSEMDVDRPSTTYTSDISSSSLLRTSSIAINLDSRWDNKVPREPPDPPYPSWFNPDHVSAEERRAFPSFFNPSDLHDGVDIYLSNRNALLFAYERAPLYSLSFTECYHHVHTSMCDLYAIYLFLVHHRLINGKTLFDNRPTFCTSKNITTATQRYRIRPLHVFKKENSDDSTRIKSGDQTARSRTVAFDQNTKPSALSRSELLYSDRYVPTQDTIQVSHQCFMCRQGLGWHAGRKYRCQFNLLFHLCQDCFQVGRFPADFSSGDFIPVPIVDLSRAKNKASGSVEWTEEETLRLLDGISNFGENWAGLAALFPGNKSEQDCITRFLSLEIEEPSQVELVSTVPISLDTSTVSDVNPSPPRLEDTPLRFAKNPITSLLSFLASVNPGLAGAAAKGILAHLPPSASMTDALSPKELTTLQDAGLLAATEQANVLARIEQGRVEALVKALTEARLRRIELKLREYEDLLGPKTEQQQTRGVQGGEEKALSSLITASYGSNPLLEEEPESSALDDGSAMDMHEDEMSTSNPAQSRKRTNDMST